MILEGGPPRLLEVLSPRASLVELSNGQRYVIKPIRQNWLGCNVVNVEAEWLAFRLFRAAGVLSPEVAVIEWPGGPGPQVASSYQPQTHMLSGYPALPNNDMDRAAVCRLLVLDAIIGNTDRHLANILWTWPGRGKLSTPIAIDHGLSMVTESVASTPLLQNLTPSFDGEPDIGAHTSWRSQVAQRQGTLLRLWRSRRLLKIAATLGPEGIRAQTDAVRRLLSDRMIFAMVHSIPDDAFYERRLTDRKEELFELLVSRRTALRPHRVIEHFEREGEVVM